MSAKSKCGSYTVVGPVNGQPGKLAHSRLFCKSLRCPYCRKPKLKKLCSSIAQFAHKLLLTRLVTLTLNPKRLGNPKESDRYLRACWRKMRVSLERKFGKTVQFIGVLEFHESGVAHLHLLVGIYIPHAWLSRAWQKNGGGKVVHVRYVDVHRVAAYLTPYLAGDKIEHTLSLLPSRARIFTTSRGIRLSEKPKSSGWWLVRRPITFLEFCSKDAAAHRYADQGAGPPVLTYFECFFNWFSIDGRDPLETLRRMLSSQGKIDFSSPLGTQK
jgi:hypothetical protein